MTRTPLAVALLLVVSLAPAAPVPKAKPATCFFPHAVGTKWEYIRDGDDKQAWTEEVVESAEKGGVVTFKVDDDIIPGRKGQHPTTYQWAGGELRLMDNGSAGYSLPRLLCKAEMKDGDVWEAKWEVRSKFLQADGEDRLTVGRAEEVKTPAGKFTATPVTRQVKGQPAMVFWYADGVGLVRMTAEGEKHPLKELKSFTPAKDKK